MHGKSAIREGMIIPYGRTERVLRERKLRIVEYKQKVFPLITSEWQHSSNFQRCLDIPDKNKGTVRNWIFLALKDLESDGKIECMRDPNFPGTYWRLKK